MDKKLITVTEYAKLKGVSQQAIYKQIKTGRLKEWVETVDGKTMINSAVFSDEGKQKLMNKDDNLAKLIETLTAQLETKDKQIDELNQRLKDVTEVLVSTQRSLQASQALHAHDTGLLPTADNRTSDAGEIIEEQVKPSGDGEQDHEPKRKSWWQRLWE